MLIVLQFSDTYLYGIVHIKVKRDSGWSGPRCLWSSPYDTVGLCQSLTVSVGL